VDRKVINMRFFFYFFTNSILIYNNCYIPQTINSLFVECCLGIDGEGIEGHLNKIKIMKDVNDDEFVLSSYRVVLEFNEK
jgi:hypothetical protein